MSALPPPLPNISTDPSLALIPPGFTLAEYLHLQNQIVTIGIVAAVVLGIILWDYFIQLPNEIALYTTEDKKLWLSPATWFFILLRYSGIVATLPSLWFTSAPTQHCQLAAILSQFGVVLAVASSGALFCFRVFAIWSDNKPIKGFIGIMYFFMIGAYVSVATQYHVIPGPRSPLGSNCQPQPIKSWAVISYASSVAFDSAVLIVTLAKLQSNNQTRRSRIGQLIYRDNLIYFAITTVTNITVLAIYAINIPSLALVKPAVLPFSTLMTVTMGTRVYLNLKLSDRRRVEGLTGGSGSETSNSVSVRGQWQPAVAPPSSPYKPPLAESSPGRYELRKLEPMV